MLRPSSTPWQVWAIVMKTVQELEPRIQDFLEGFPCPPPWKEELLFRLNWTSCIGPELGQRAKMYMVDKCKVRAGILMEEDGCGLACPEIIVSVTTGLVIILIAVIFILYCARRKRAKAASPSHQSSLTAHPDGNAKYYTSCHYASTPIRQLQTNLTENGTETLVVNDPDNHSLYTPGCYPQHNCQSPISYPLNPNTHHPHPHQHNSPFHNHTHHHHHHPHYHHPHHQQPSQPTRYINTKYGPVPAHTSSLIVPPHSRYNLSHYRKFDPVYSSSSVSNSDRSPVYESIGDSDSIRDGAGRQNSISECEFCECGLERSSHDPGFYSGYMDLEPRPTSESDTYTDKLGTSGFPPDIEPPCPPMCSDGYYEDGRRSQTLPLRPIRGHPLPESQQGNNNGGKGNNSTNSKRDSLGANDDIGELSPLNQQQQQEEPLLMSLSSPSTSVKNGSTGGNGASRLSRTISSEPQLNENNTSSFVNGNTFANNNDSTNNNNNNNSNNTDQRMGMRRRPSSSTSQNGDGSALSSNGAQSRRPIPALHAHYFAPNNTEEIS